MSRISDILSKQVAVAETLLQRAIAIPDGDRNTRVAGYIRYDESITRPLEKDVEAWQTETTEFLRVLYGEDARQVADFQRSINNKNNYFKFREECQSELQDCISKLKAFIKADAIQQEFKDGNTNEQSGKKKAPMVFISHSSKDIEFVEALVTLLESIGFNNKTLFCSSIPDYWIGLSKDIFASLKQLFTNHELFVIFIQSPRYYESAVSLNEMGAAWVLQTDYCSILTKDMQKEEMCGVFDDHTIFLKVDAPQVEARMNELKNTLTDMFDLPAMTDTTWERKRNSFLKAVNAIEYLPKTESGTKEKSPVSEEYMALQIAKLKQEAIEKKQARIRGNIIDAPGNGNRKLKIFNAGQAVARNVNVEWLNPDEEVYVQWEFGLIGEISPQNGRSYNIGLCMGHPETMRLRYTWADDYKEDNVFEEDVQL
jgi:hypothetical protein